MSLVITDYNKFIGDRKPIVIKSKGKGKLARSGKEKPFLLPPLNTKIVLTKLKKQKPLSKKKARAIALPTNYNLKDFYPIVQCGDRYDPSTSMFQQYSCGCCWAYATATSISDAFVVKNNYATNPNLSWTYPLACFPHANMPGDFPASDQCGGGDVPTLFTWVVKNGLPTNVCVDYSWCLNSPECVGSGTAKVMNPQIPSCGCYKEGAFWKYKIKDVNRVNLDSTNDQNPEQIGIIQTQLKQHIYLVGTIVGCFHVLSNIVDKNNGKVGDFKTEKNPEGIYLECVGGQDNSEFNIPPDGNSADLCTSNKDAPAVTILGAHAVSIVGWGVAPVDKSLLRPDIAKLAPNYTESPTNSNMAMVPYWWVRNSWGTSFAEGGFFKMAMYPYNRISVLERSIVIKTGDGGQVMAGGCVIFFPDDVVRETFDQNNQKGLEKPQESSDQGGQKSDSGVNTGVWGSGGSEGGVGSSSNGEGGGGGESSGVAFVEKSFDPANDTLPPVKSEVPTTSPPSAAGTVETSAPVVANTFGPAVASNNKFGEIEVIPIGEVGSSATVQKWKRILMFSAAGIFVLGIVGGGLYFWWKRRKQALATAAATGQQKQQKVAVAPPAASPSLAPPPPSIIVQRPAAAPATPNVVYVSAPPVQAPKIVVVQKAAPPPPPRIITIPSPQAPAAVPKPPQAPAVVARPPQVPAAVPKPPQVPTAVPKPPQAPAAIPKPPQVPTAVPKPPQIPSAVPKPPQAPSAVPKPPQIPAAVPKPPQAPATVPKPPQIPAAVPKPPQIPRTTASVSAAVPKPPQVPRTTASVSAAVPKPPVPATTTAKPTNAPVVKTVSVSQTTSFKVQSSGK